MSRFRLSVFYKFFTFVVEWQVAAVGRRRAAAVQSRGGVGSVSCIGRHIPVAFSCGMGAVYGFFAGGLAIAGNAAEGR